jgi:hypothetical protein
MPRTSSSSPRRSASPSLKNGGETRSSGDPPNRGGAPRGNQNALKHGFYSRHLTRSDLADLETCSPTGLKDEIGLTRVVIRRLASLVSGSETLAESVAVSHAIALLTASLERLLKTQSKFDAAEDNPLLEINRAIDELAESGRFPILAEGLSKTRSG